MCPANQVINDGKCQSCPPLHIVVGGVCRPCPEKDAGGNGDG